MGRAPEAAAGLAAGRPLPAPESPRPQSATARSDRESTSHSDGRPSATSVDLASGRPTRGPSAMALNHRCRWPGAVLTTTPQACLQGRPPRKPAPAARRSRHHTTAQTGCGRPAQRDQPQWPDRPYTLLHPSATCNHSQSVRKGTQTSQACAVIYSLESWCSGQVVLSEACLRIDRPEDSRHHQLTG